MSSSNCIRGSPSLEHNPSLLRASLVKMIIENFVSLSWLESSFCQFAPFSISSENHGFTFCKALGGHSVMGRAICLLSSPDQLMKTFMRSTPQNRIVNHPPLTWNNYLR